MNPLEITLIVIGVIIMIISCIMVDRSQKASAAPVAGKAFLVEEALTKEDIERIKNKLDELLEQTREEVIIKTDDTLSKISNEKIMAVNEFSEQILEKINRNHEEVIFLYNMLNDKEKELKSAVREIDSSKKKVQDILEITNKSDNQQNPKDKKTQTVTKPLNQASGMEKSTNKSADIINTEPDAETPDLMGTNNNTKILELYSKGKSVMEISKLLDLGQGEVKLVIDLFKGKK